MRPKKLNEDEIQQLLSTLPDWTRTDETIAKTYSFKDFVHSMEFVNHVAESAQQLNHHPDIDIRYSKVTLTLSTHDVGGLTKNDFDLASISDEFAEAIVALAIV